MRARVVQKRRGFMQAVVEDVLAPGPDRREAPCPHYGECGGRDLQHLDDAHQAAGKRDIVVERLRMLDIPAQIGFQRRFDFGYRSAKDLVDSGRLGRLYSVRTTTHDYDPPPPGYHDTGIFRDTQIHDFDILRYVTGQEVVEA